MIIKPPKPGLGFGILGFGILGFGLAWLGCGKNDRSHKMLVFLNFQHVVLSGCLDDKQFCHNQNGHGFTEIIFK